MEIERYRNTSNIKRKKNNISEEKELLIKEIEF